MRASEHHLNLNETMQFAFENKGKSVNQVKQTKFVKTARVIPKRQILLQLTIDQYEFKKEQIWLIYKIHDKMKCLKNKKLYTDKKSSNESKRK